MSTLFEPSLSTSTMRRPSIAALTPADSLPSIDFGFDDLRERMARFTTRFDDFIAAGRKRVLEERNQFRMNLAELHEDQRLKNHSIEILVQRSNSHAQTLTREAAETAEIQSAIATLTAQRDTRAEQRDRFRSSIVSTQKAIAQRLEAQRAHSDYLDSQARFNGPELDFWVDYLCLRIEGAGMVDRLKFIFTHVDEKDWEREAWFELDTAKTDYRVETVRPKLETEKVEGVVERLNESRDLTIFLKGMRELFTEAMKS